MKKKFTLFFLLVAAAIVGNIVARSCDGVTYFNWLSYSKSIGIEPGEINIVSVINLTFGMNFSLSIAQIICFIIAIILYPKLVKMLDT